MKLQELRITSYGDEIVTNGRETSIWWNWICETREESACWGPGDAMSV